MPDDSKIRGAVAFARSVAVFSKSNIKYPVQVVFNGPVRSNRMFKFAGVVCVQAAEIIARLLAGLVVSISGGGHRYNALQPRPGVARFQPRDVVCDTHCVCFNSPCPPSRVCSAGTGDRAEVKSVATSSCKRP